MDLAVVKASEMLILKMKTRDLGWLGTTQLDALHGFHRSRRKNIAHSLQTPGPMVLAFESQMFIKLSSGRSWFPCVKRAIVAPGPLVKICGRGRGERERERQPFLLAASRTEDSKKTESQRS